MVNVACNNKSGIIGAVAALLIITLSIPTGQTFIYVTSRVFETFCGVFVAILVNTDVELIKNKWFNKNTVMLDNITYILDRLFFSAYNKEDERSLS